MPSDQFTHIFIDEAGHGTEPEALCAISGFMSAKTKLILAGDHKQLGPIIRSPIAKKFKFDMSLLERLCSTIPVYQPIEKRYNRKYITKLLHNYRSHPDILNLPSKLFYENELIAAGNSALTHSLLNWEHLPNKKFPILFYGVTGKDEQEGNSPSWFNATEASQVFKFIQSLMSSKLKQRVSANQIGVVTPYRKQVEKLRILLKGKGLDAVDVGSVEEYQGQERPVIIISTVRSNVQHLEFDYEHNLGFVKNEKRFNVAITRAMALLIIIGNPFVLSKDKNWNALLQYCRDNNAYAGCPYEETHTDKEAQEIIEISQLGINQLKDEEDEDDPNKNNNDEWVFVDKL